MIHNHTIIISNISCSCMSQLPITSKLSNRIPSLIGPPNFIIHLMESGGGSIDEDSVNRPTQCIPLKNFAVKIGGGLI